ncbi:MAG: pilus assembly protein [Proteobacteria bacterium]|nr:pilus assembly protein [Pseudomonadota bacterium]
MSGWIRTLLGAAPAKRFAKHRAGTSAVEFALIAPVLVIATMSISDATAIATGSSRMQTAIRAAIQYAMNGGTDMTAAQSLGVASWNGKPSSGTLSVATACTCGGSAGTCGVLCADGTVPYTYVTATATAPLGGDMYTLTKTVTETVRTR